MSAINLPHPLENYFAFAEMEPRGDARRFTITLPYYQDGKLERIQWWWHVKHAEEKIVGDAGVAARRSRETQRFARHIERWLANTQQCLSGNDAIPIISPAPAVINEPATVATAPSSTLPIANQNAA